MMEEWVKELQNQANSKFIIKWKNLSVEDAMWEDEQFI